MSNVLKEMLDRMVTTLIIGLTYGVERVSVLTSDGRRMLGKLRAVDHLANLVLENSTERIYSLDSEMEEVALGLYILRGENVYVMTLFYILNVLIERW